MNAWRNSYTKYKIGRNLDSLGKIKEAYKSTPENSPVRKFTSQMVAHCLTCKDFTSDCKSIAELFSSNNEICKDVLQVIKNAEGTVPDPRKAKYCEFHQHAPGENSCPNDETHHTKFRCGM